MKNACSSCCPPRRPVHGEAVEALAQRFKAMGDPTRLSILAMLRDAEDALCACEIESSFDLSQPTISHHLRQLKAAGLIHAVRRGTWMHFHLAPDGVAALENFVKGLAPAKTTYVQSTTKESAK